MYNRININTILLLPSLSLITSRDININGPNASMMPNLMLKDMNGDKVLWKCYESKSYQVMSMKKINEIYHNDIHKMIILFPQ